MEGPHLECTVRRFLPESPFVTGNGSRRGGGSCRMSSGADVSSVGLTPIGMFMSRR